MVSRVSFFLPIWKRSDNVRKQVGYEPTSGAASLAAPMVVTVWSSVADFQVLAMRLAAKMFLPGTVWVALKLFMDLVGLMMDLLGKRYLSRESLALFDFQTIKAVWDVTISHLGVKASLLYTVAFRYTFFGEWKNFCSSKFVQLELLNNAKARTSKNLAA